jgi:DNA-binding CsgD family transcriptional regulator
MNDAAPEAEFTYRDDPAYQAFCTAIMDEVINQQIIRNGISGQELDTVRHNKLYAAWYVASTFRKHWQHPSARAENDMLWILYHREWTKAQGYIAVIAWWRVHRRKITESMLLDLKKMTEKVWSEVQKKKIATKREKQQSSLQDRIIAMLQQHPATTAFLAAKLNATPKAVDSHLYRLKKKGKVDRLSWGLYGLSDPQAAKTAPTTAKPAPLFRKPISITSPSSANSLSVGNLDDIDDAFAEPRPFKSAAYRQPPMALPRELPIAAEPRWSKF